jgi:hypothetical protein
MELPHNAVGAEGAESIVAEWPRLHNQQMAANASWSWERAITPEVSVPGYTQVVISPLGA